MAERAEYVRGGHVYYDARDGRWVALSYVRVLGRFASKAEATGAVEKERRKHETEGTGYE